MDLNELDLDELTRAISEADALEAVTELTTRIADDATANTPTGETGRASRSISSFVADEGGPVGYVTSDDPFWHLVEYGSVNNDPYRPITRAAQENAGLFVDGGA